mmetsp:Transcript_6288/g.7646  ORF Transcript_6288/g.7646 Transcript_6288/m.7646 type:complete len:288 (+) Transcript_6288:128-991(+)
MDLSWIPEHFLELKYYEDAFGAFQKQLLVLDNADVFQYVSSLPIYRNIVILIALAIFDILVGSRTKARWFAVHTFANLLVVLAGFNAVVAAFKDPVNACDPNLYFDDSWGGNASSYPVIITNSIHLYHMLAFRLNAADYFHHLLFLPTIGLAGQYYEWGAVSAFNAFFMSGLPGGLIYLTLVLVKHGAISSMLQKRLSAVINVYLRGPSILCVSMLLYIGVIYGKAQIPLPIAASIGVLATYNSLYYTKQSVANYAITHALELSKSQEFPLDKKLMAIIKAPQNDTC